MKYLKTILTLVVLFCLLAAMRAGVKAWLPGVYAAVWGGPQPQPQQQSEPQGPKGPTLNQKPVQQARVDPGKPPTPPPESESEAVFATGRIWNAKQSWVVMSDGTVRSLDDNTEPDKPRLQRIRRHYMDYEGKRYYYKPKPDKEIPGKPQTREAEIFVATEDVKKELKEPEKG